MEMMNGFTVCVLLYGDHPDLAELCLRSIVQRADWNLVKDIRVACNAVSSHTRTLVDEILRAVPSAVGLHIYVSEENRYKYPMMRRMFYDGEHPIVTQFVMWFDDDSYIDPEQSPLWWHSVYAAASRGAVTGAVYGIRPIGEQLQWLPKQPWYRGKHWPPGFRFRFVTGGWWVAKTRFLQEHDYPFPTLVHNGGDVMLGELVRQTDSTIISFTAGIHINADGNGKNSSAKRRGESLPPAFSRGMQQANWEFPLAITDPRRNEGQSSPAPARIIRLPGF